MSIASEITRLQSAKADLKTAIEGKGVTVPSATLLDGYADLVDDIQTGGGDPDIWVRPSDWPDLDNIVLPNFACVYLTYDLSKCDESEWFISVMSRGLNNGSGPAERGHLDSQGNFIVDETFSSGSDYWSSWTFRHSLSASDGMVQLWRIRNPDDSFQTGLRSSNSSFAQDQAAVQPMVEILYVNINSTKYITSFGSTGTGASNYTESVIIVGNSDKMGAYNSWQYRIALRRFKIKNTEGIFTDSRAMLANCPNLTEVDYGKSEFPDTTNGRYSASSMYSLRRLVVPVCVRTGALNSIINTLPKCEYLDMRNMDISGATDLQNSFIANMYSLKELHMEGMDFSADTSTSTYNPSSHLPVLEELYPPIVYRSQTWNMNTLSHDSLVRLFNALPTVTSKTVTIGTYNQSKLTAAEIAVATSKGWTVA